MIVKSILLAEDIYEASNGKTTIIYAPLKNLVARKWKYFPNAQLKLLHLIRNKFSIPHNNLKPTVLELDMSHACSLNCVYCSVNSNNNDKDLKMDFNKAKLAIDRLLNTSKETAESFTVVFIGKGEPTLNWKVLIQCVAYIRDQSKALGVTGKTIVVTNGIISPARAIWLAKNINQIALSWDGNREIQNTQRPTLRRNVSYNIVERTASIFKKEGARFEIRATWTNLNVKRMAEFTEIFLKYSPFELNYQPLIETGRGISSGISKPEADIFIDGFMESKKIANKSGIDVIMPSVEISRLNRKFCHAYEGAGFHLSANGSVNACECVFGSDNGLADKYLTYGKISGSQFEINENKLSFLKSIKVDNIPSCRRCFVRWHCAGGCLNTHLEHSNDPLSERKNMECYITKNIIWRMLSEVV